jgi:hypothetical protein
MKKTNDNAIMKLVSYSSPEAFVLDIRSEGILCSSNTGSSAADMTLVDPLTGYEQIF